MRGSLTGAPSVFAPTSNAERRSYAATHLEVFTRVWLPMAYPVATHAEDLNAGMLAELYPHIYTYGPYGDSWMRSLNRCLKLADDPSFLQDFLLTFTDLFDETNDEAIGILNEIKRGARDTHRHATDHMVSTIAFGNPTYHPVFTLLKRIMNRTGVLNHPLYMTDHEEFREAIIAYCYHYLLQDVCTGVANVNRYTANATKFMHRWVLHG